MQADMEIFITGERGEDGRETVKLEPKRFSDAGIFNFLFVDLFQLLLFFFYVRFLIYM